jgi:hypothetical protein
LALPSGATQPLAENIRLADGVLYIAPNASGEGMNVNENEPLNKVSGSSPSQPTEPVSNKAAMATTYSEVKYAVCSLQGALYVVDLSKVDLNNSSSSSARIGTTACEDSAKVSWYNDSYGVSVDTSSGTPQITFNSLDDSYIHTDSYFSGLEVGEYARRAYSVIGGNSGDCYLTKTPGVQGLLCE